MSSQKKNRFRRGIYVLPSFFTVGNLLCGYYSILASAKGTIGDLDTAAKAIGIAVVLDVLDGRVARMGKVSSAFGKEFDSLADVISFGIAPAFLALAWGLRGLNPGAASHPALVQHIYQIGWMVTFFFVICGAWRLARFNIQVSDASNPGPGEHRYFVGLPIPAAAGVIAAIVHAVQEPITEWYWAAAWLAVVAGLAYLMVSPIRYHSFKHVDLRRRRPSVLVIGIALVILLIWLYSRPVLLVIAVTYLLLGLVGLVRRRLLGRTG